MSEKETALLLEQQEPCADNLLEQAAPQTKDRTESIAQPVKKINSLVTLRLVKNLPVRDMVEVVRVLYPKYDKIIQSKCEHGDEYGVQIRPDAFQALMEKFAPEIVKRRARDKKRNTGRIQVRLTEVVAAKLRKALEEDGTTVQAWIEKQVYAYLEGKTNHD